MDKAEKAGLEVGGRDSGAERRGKGTRVDGKSQDDPRMSPDIGCSEIDFTPAMPRATSVRERGKIGERGKKKEKGRGKKESVRETRKTHLRHALFPSPVRLKFDDFPPEFFRVEMIFERRWFKRNSKKNSVREDSLDFAL